MPVFVFSFGKLVRLKATKKSGCFLPKKSCSILIFFHLQKAKKAGLLGLCIFLKGISGGLDRFLKIPIVQKPLKANCPQF